MVNHSSTNDNLAAPCVSEKINPTTFWKDNERQYPSLARLVKEILGVPSSSAAVERVFSITEKSSHQI